MNAKQLIAAVAVFAAAGSAFADASYPPETKVTSSKTRAEVIAEMEQARAQGLMNQSDAVYPLEAQVKSSEQARKLATQSKPGREVDATYSGA
ncbi:DUF4148 domain-containing protein [Paraherbaspirillum soli]|uniref:DUF4148 domain-containing protein n=1 Tax=Paraherbaspirillum soli TaxID=631222 RepID=A0ABW0MES2_9BURK